MDSASIGQLLLTIPRGKAAKSALLRETHISWVILCGEFAFKIKKPVNFGFLDFSSLALRRHYCEEELRLNRRFSPELYLAVVPVIQGERGPELDGAGPVIDYAVKMRRFQEEQLLDHIAAHQGLDNLLVRDLARELARVHEQLPGIHPNPDSHEPGTPGAFLEAIEQNFRQIRNYHLPDEQLKQLQAIEQWSLRCYDNLRPVIVQRLKDGKVIDGHGDAHLGNIARVDGAVRLFDCIEFNACFRIMDSISEIAFLSMDMNARGYHCAARRLLIDYLEYSGDYAGLPLLELYRSYFAMVRAKVNLLKEQNKNTALNTTPAYREFLRYLELAQSCTATRRVFLAITHGFSGSGKSTIAGKLVEESGAVRIRSDVERKRLADMAPEQRSEPQQQDSLYSTAMSRRTFARLEKLAEVILKAGFAVIVDATFLHRQARENFHLLARKLSVPYVIVDCVAEPEQLRRRLIERERQARDASEANVAVMEQQLRSAQALTPEENDYRVTVDEANSLATLWLRLQAHCFK